MERTGAQMLAQIEYAAWIGFQHMEPPPSSDRLAALYAEFLAMTRAYGAHGVATRRTPSDEQPGG